GLRALLCAHGATVFMLSPKRVHDAREVFDGVPSLHDAKSCVVMSQLHRQGVSRRYAQVSAERLQMRALVSRREIFEKPLQMHLGELEALLGRHWPELLVDMDIWRRRTPLELLCEHPCPAEVVAHADAARALMRRVSRSAMKQDEIDRVIASASSSVGLAASEQEREVIRAVGPHAVDLGADLAARLHAGRAQDARGLRLVDRIPRELVVGTRARGCTRDRDHLDRRAEEGQPERDAPQPGPSEIVHACPVWVSELCQRSTVEPRCDHRAAASTR
nr:hypothetical protein [Myxococcota bacterium]